MNGERTPGAMRSEARRCDNRARPRARLWSAAVGGVLCTAVVLRADTLAVYNFNQTNLLASSVAAGLTAANFAYSGSSTATGFVAGVSGTRAYTAAAWPTVSTPDDYFTFSLSVQPGYLAEIYGVTFRDQRSTTGPHQWVTRYSTNGTVFHELGTNNSSTVFTQWAASARRILDLRGTLYVRIYGVNASDGNGTWRLDDVTVDGAVSIDTGRRVVRYRGFDGADQETWSATTNAGSGSIAESSARQYTGAKSLRLCGSADGASDPSVTFNAVAAATLASLRLQVAYSAQNTTVDNDLYLDTSTNGWGTVDRVRLVDGYGGTSVAFGATNASSPATAGANPFVAVFAGSPAEVDVRVLFDEASGENNSSRYYYVDDVRLTGVPVPANGAPSVADYGAGAITASRAAVVGHVRGGYPYPNVTLYWGPNDGGTSAGGWHRSADIGVRPWGLFTNTLSGLAAGQLYYYRFFASNSQGQAWAPTSLSFTTAASALTAARRVYLDSFSVGTALPMSIDRDTDGMADRWEEVALSGVNGDKAADPDGDGVSNVREYLAGTDPENPASRMGIVALDLASPVSTSMQILVGGGDPAMRVAYPGIAPSSRRFILRAGNNDPTAPRVDVGGCSDGGTGTNLFIDTGAAGLYASRYYQVCVSYGGAGYTNTEEWAMHVQARPVNQSFLICSPVNHGAAQANNLNSTLGRQLARGLHADADPARADRIWLYGNDGATREYVLVPGAGGTPYWWDPDLNQTANVHLAAGTAFWVVRGSGAATRSTTVFGGRSYTAASVTNIAFPVANDGWRMFGWPLPQPRRHRNTESSGAYSTPPNQLGFERIGSGGTTDDTRRPGELGDQIWVWQNNQWAKYYRLIGHAGANWDGRWWDRFTGTFADFSLEPGVGYYYHHRVNQWGGTNFVWRPAAE